MARDTKYFKLQVDDENGLVLQTKVQEPKPKSKVIVDQNRTEKDDNQWWRYDEKTQTLRTMKGDLCLDIFLDGKLRVVPYYEYAWSQKFVFNVQTRADRAEVLVAEADTLNVEAFDEGNPTQAWYYSSTHTDKKRHFFMLTSHIAHENGTKYVATASGGNGDVVTLKPASTSGTNEHQVWWYTPGTKTIQTKLNEYALTDPGVTTSLNGEEAQQWRFILQNMTMKKVVGTEDEAQTRPFMTDFHWRKNNVTFKIVH